MVFVASYGVFFISSPLPSPDPLNTSFFTLPRSFSGILIIVMIFSIVQNNDLDGIYNYDSFNESIFLHIILHVSCYKLYVVN